MHDMQSSVGLIAINRCVIRLQVNAEYRLFAYGFSAVDNRAANR